MAVFKLDTPDAAMGLVACRRFNIPVELLPHFMGALADLTNSWRWEEIGTMTKEEAIQSFHIMIANSEDGYCMIGDIVPTTRSTLPDRYLLCDGATYDRVDYPILYDAIDAIWIVDADHFQVPDLQGRTIVGSGSGAGLTPRTPGDLAGSETHQLVEGELPSHNHTVHDHGIGGVLEEPLPGAPLVVTVPDVTPTTTGSTGSDQAHENMQPSLVVKYAIIAK